MPKATQREGGASAHEPNGTPWPPPKGRTLGPTLHLHYLIGFLRGLLPADGERGPSKERLPRRQGPQRLQLCDSVLSGRKAANGEWTLRVRLLCSCKQDPLSIRKRISRERLLLFRGPMGSKPAAPEKAGGPLKQLASDRHSLRHTESQEQKHQQSRPRPAGSSTCCVRATECTRRFVLRPLPRRHRSEVTVLAPILQKGKLRPREARSRAPGPPARR